jgi:hypothetical protein
MFGSRAQKGDQLVMRLHLHPKWVGLFVDVPVVASISKEQQKSRRFTDGIVH